MKSLKMILALLTASLLLAACGMPASATPTPTLLPTVIADKTIVTDGRLEPVRFAELALSASGLVS